MNRNMTEQEIKINTIIDEAISGADRLIKELKEREETQQ